MIAKLKLYGFAFFVASLSISLLYIYPNLEKKCQFYVEKVSSLVGSIFCNTGETEKKIAEGDTLFTPEELQKYDGDTDSLGLYVALLGKVYDVKKGEQHYKPGSAYQFFAGKDASKAYVTGDFKEEGLTDDVTELPDDQIAGLVQWQEFYDKEYIYVGKVIGRYYDKYGQPTENMIKVNEAVARAKAEALKLLNEREIFPPCNSEWEHEKGGRVWCSVTSGGVERTWKGVPRQFFRAGSTSPSCVCVRATGSPSIALEGIADGDRGDLDNPNVKEYDDCAADAESCNIL